MKSIAIQYFKIPSGELILGSFGEALCLCDWRFRKGRTVIDTRIQKGLDARYVEEESTVIQKTKWQLNEYLNGLRTSFDIPFIMTGSEFQKSVWSELLKIPYGATETYLDLSRRLNNVKAIRAVASANGANAISIIIPCHRIIGTKGELTGYAGGLAVKRKLLQLESALESHEQLELF